jgi:hypothetical protein
MTRSILQRCALVLGVAVGVFAPPAAVRAQKALVYCPVNVDATGCNAIVTALTGPAYPLGVDRGYDGTNGTVDLKTVDLFGYSVFVVPSLADDASSQPYAKLRDPEVVEHLKAALIGRMALWSGTPDQGATNRAAKDALIQNLAAWAAGAFATAKGPGLVGLLDASSSAVARYDWLRAITPLPVTADANLLIYDAARALNARGTGILTSPSGAIAYSNMATYGFQVPNGAPGVGLDAVGQTGSSQGGQVILLTMEAGNTSAAVVRTDKDDYAPGQTVTITGSGWQAGETVKLTLHMDPLRDSDTELTATADGSGNFTNTSFAPAEYDVGVRFVLTAVGQASGLRAQTTFTDDTKLKNNLGIAPASRTISPGSSTTYTVTVSFNGNANAGRSCTAALSVTTALPSGATASFSPAQLTASSTQDLTSTLTITTTAATPTGSTNFTVRAQGTGDGTGTNDCGANDVAAAAGTLVVQAAPNAAPILASIGSKTVNENATLSFTATATDANSPPQTLTFSLDAGAPAGATINSSTGAFTWTPTEAQGPGTYSVTVRVADNGTPALDDFETVSITVNEVNAAPVLGTIGPKNVNEGAALTFTATATDGDIPANSLTFSLAAGADPVPAGATINGTSGAFSWTPTEGQGPGVYKFKVVVTDNGAPALSDDEEITVTVAEVNSAPLVTPIPDKTVDELTPLTFTAAATDSDLPANTLTFSLEGSVPPGASITPAGVFTWTPTEAQGPGTYNVTVRATDNGTPSQFGETIVKITVNEVNAPPTLVGVPASATIPELAAYAFDANATDPDLPSQTFTFSLESAPAGATIDASTGEFSWTPNEAQGPGTYTFKVKVSDGIATAESSITLTVTEVNEAPVLGAIGNKTVDELAALTFTATATDGDVPANTLTFSLVGAPAGATITAAGAFSWTPTEAQGPGSYTFTVKVGDNGTPSLGDEEQITVTVNEVNVLPALTDVPASATIPELAAYTFDANATDPDLPAQTLTFSLENGPAGASINPTTGAFSWTPSEAQGPGVYTFKVKVSDGIGATEQSVTLTVEEVNVAPVLATIGDRTIDELALLSFSASASDADLPANTLTFSLIGAPTGASINSSSGAFTWTPTEEQGPGTYTFTVKVTDNGTPALSDEETITVTVKEVNVAPVLGAIGNFTLDEETNLSFTATATDSDLPPNTLTFSLIAGEDAVPAGATINSSTGAFSWTPSEAQGPGTYKFKVRVTDNGSPTLYDEEEITVTVNEVNLPPVLAAIGNKTVDEEAALTFTASATDPDLPPNTLTFSLVGAPDGASITPAGAFSWTPTEAQGPGSYTFTVKVTDNGGPALSDEEQITVTVKEINKAPTVATIGPKAVNEGVALTFTATASDPDLPANTLTFSLISPPAGASIDPSTGAFSWTPPDGPGTVSITVRATDNGMPALYDDETFTVTVNNVAPTATFNVPAGPFNEGQTFSISLSNPVDVAADIGTLKYAFDCGTGSGYSAPSATATATCPALDNPGQGVKGKVIDKDGGYTESTGSVPIDNAAPVPGLMTISPSDVIPINTTITASTPFTDVGTKDTHTGAYAWDDGSATTAATISEANGSGSASATHKYMATGVYVVQLTLRDKDGAEVSTTYRYVVVYDPNAGFVTGGGWITSPAGAYATNPGLAGKANFGFVSKYKKGQSTPDGETEFQFQAAGFNFKSTSYEWLVIAGAKAQYKGSGTINGSGDYFFMLTAIDGQTNGGGGIDKFRIKVWNKTTLAVIYDNGLGVPDTSDPVTALGGGSIQIHEK